MYSIRDVNPIYLIYLDKFRNKITINKLKDTYSIDVEKKYRVTRQTLG